MDKRISFPVTPELHDRVHKIPWGIRAGVLRALVERVMDTVDEHGSMVYGAIMTGEFSIDYKSKGRKK